MEFDESLVRKLVGQITVYDDHFHHRVQIRYQHRCKKNKSRCSDHGVPAEFNKCSLHIYFAVFIVLSICPHAPRQWKI